MVIASRFADPDLVPEMPWIKKWGNKRVAGIVNKLTGHSLHDVSCGFRAYSRDAALRATLLKGHTYTHEVVLDLAFLGMRVIEALVRVIGVRKVGRERFNLPAQIQRVENPRVKAYEYPFEVLDV